MQVRSVFISDIHLGYRGCRADQLLDFLGTIKACNIFVIGDLIDIWAMKRSLYWPRQHQEVLKALLEHARNGSRVVYVPGNHDDLLRDFCGFDFCGIEIHRRLIHRTADGRRMLVLHGDEFDDSVRFGSFSRWLGSTIYGVMLRVNHGLYRLCRRFGFGHWSLTAWIKGKVADARHYIARFEEAAAGAAARAGCDGIICGHIHYPAMRNINGVLYCNDGDWVENCTSLIEDMNGRLQVLCWTETQASSAVLAPIHPAFAARALSSATRISASSELAPILKHAGVAQSAPRISSAKVR